MNKRFLKQLKTLTMGSALLLLAACSKDDNSNQTPATSISYGSFVKVGNGQARSYIVKNADGSPAEIGFNFTEDALSGLPEHNTAYVLPMPADNKSIINHISFDYTVHGHGPEGVYNVPHFDVHYYMISESEKDAIGTSETDPKIDILPAAQFIPKNYIPGANEPKMGKHWADTTAAEFHGKKFEKTFIYGSYNGKFIFLEPMIALDYLKTKPNVTLPIAQGAKIQQIALVPQQYAIEWQKDRREYTISLNDLKLRQQ
ncbi:DUF5602 domain-containing protein [Mucilaginibacter defluvii]|uniref:DUF5602 domain-containing protein n=1 Tax=Mucilaginibacter defluvii TaxID=1196019 RepID=A0ABP9G1G6_9SPHI